MDNSEDWEVWADLCGIFFSVVTFGTLFLAHTPPSIAALCAHHTRTPITYTRGSVWVRARFSPLAPVTVSENTHLELATQVDGPFRLRNVAGVKAICRLAGLVLGLGGG